MDEAAERRLSKRWRTVLKGQVIFNSRSSVLDCTVRDLSDTGARIYLADVSELPAEFELAIPNRGIRVPTCLMWSRGANHGLKFLQEVKAWKDPIRRAAA